MCWGTSTMATCVTKDRFHKRLSLDLTIPESVLVRRGAISFGSRTLECSRPRLERRGAISYDKSDKNAQYVRKLGDVRIRSQQESLHQQIKNNLLAADRTILQNLSQPNYKTRCTQKFVTISGMKKRRKSILKSSSATGNGLLDDFYKSQTKCLLSKTSDWSFDVFSLNNSSNGRPLFHIVLKLFQEHNLIEFFNLDIVKLMKFTSLVEENYHQNPYHNAIHAADVTQAMHCYLIQEKIARHLTPLETLISLVSAITHDLGHPGVNQAFLIATSNHLASLYKNNAVLENHHWRTAVGLLYESGLLDHLSRNTRHSIEEQLKSLILATDMARQQEFYNRLKKHVDNRDLDMSKFEDRHFILQIALKCADISNPCRNWSVCKTWSERVCDEFFQQGDYERKLSLEITNLCDRYKFTVPKIQTGFIDYVVQPLFREFERFMPCDVLSEQLNNLLSNRNHWQVIIDCKSTIVDINSNLETKECCDTETYNSNLPSPTTLDSQSNFEKSLTDIHQVHSDIAMVAERLDWLDSLDRRNSLPTASLLQANLYLRRESFPQVQTARRMNLQPTSINHAVSFDQLVEKLTQVDKECSWKNGNKLSLDNLLADPRLSTLSPNDEASRLSNYLLTKRLILK